MSHFCRTHGGSSPQHRNRWAFSAAQPSNSSVLEATLGPAIARLRRTFPTADTYVDFFKAHPAFVGHCWAARLPGLRDEAIPGCNHYAILFDDRCASTIVNHLTSPT
ncbi:hypothetical protein [Nonomuraea sp. NPDC003201]